MDPHQLTTDQMKRRVSGLGDAARCAAGLAVEPSRVRLRVQSRTIQNIPSVATADCPQLPAVDGLGVEAVEAPSGFVAAVAARDGLPSRRLTLPEIVSVKS